MPNNKFYTFSLILISLGLGYLCYLLLKPFLAPIAWALVFSILFFPIYAFFRKRVKWKSVASAITLLIILVTLLGPFSYLSILLAKELRAMASGLEKGELINVREVLENPKAAWVLDRMKALLQVQEADMGNLLQENISKTGLQLIGKATKGVKNLFLTLLNFVMMMFTTFFFLRDGPDIMKRLRDYMPFSGQQKARLERQVKDMVVSTIFGGVVVALVQGLLAGTVFSLLGIKAPVLWGTAIAIMSFVPVLGTFSVWGSIVVYLVVQGALLKAFVLLIVGTFGISLVDNILKPIIIGGRTKMPTLLIFFCVLGGLKLFGPIGLIMGPLSIALFLSVFEIFRNLEGGANAYEE